MNAPPEPQPTSSLWLIALGGAALLCCMGLGTLGVIARHLGIPLIGDVELAQSLMIISASVALLSATHARRHARVHLVVNRLSTAQRQWLSLVSAILSTLFFALLSIGLGWITLELHGAHEESELLHIPYAPLRWVALTTMLVAMVLSATRVRARALR